MVSTYISQRISISVTLSDSQSQSQSQSNLYFTRELLQLKTGLQRGPDTGTHIIYTGHTGQDITVT